MSGDDLGFSSHKTDEYYQKNGSDQEDFPGQQIGHKTGQEIGQVKAQVRGHFEGTRH